MRKNQLGRTGLGIGLFLIKKFLSIGVSLFSWTSGWEYWLFLLLGSRIFYYALCEEVVAVLGLRGGMTISNLARNAVVYFSKIFLEFSLFKFDETMFSLMVNGAHTFPYKLIFGTSTPFREKKLLISCYRFVVVVNFCWKMLLWFPVVTPIAVVTPSPVTFASSNAQGAIFSD